MKLRSRMRRTGAVAGMVAVLVGTAGCQDKQPAAEEGATSSEPATAEVPDADTGGIDWREATFDNITQVRGAQDWFQGVLRMGYHKYGLPIDGDPPEDMWVDYGIGLCASVDAADGDPDQLVAAVAANDGNGMFTTEDFTVSMYEAQVRLATSTLCPEFDTWSSTAGEAADEGFRSVLADFLAAWENEDRAAMAEVAADPDAVTLDAARDNPLIPPEGEADCDPLDATGQVNCYVETSAGDWGITVQLAPAADGGYEVIRLLPTYVG